jgi:D-alanyl-D-alanine carboxypeptidase/D-alanyl-D-alanine-endopeptidase (penicillin-binding protein 4)
MRQLVVLVMACLCLPALAQSIPYEERLPLPVARALRAAGIPQQAVGVVVQETGAVFPRVSVNAGQAMNPASVMKLFTTFAALELLGPAYIWRTEALVAAPPAESDGVLAGDLFLHGSGDPKLTFEQFWLLLRQLRARGIRDIRGDLVLDRSAFAVPDHDEGAFDGRPLRPYNVGPDALLLNFKSVRMTLLPEGGNGGRVLALPEPTPSNLDVVNLIKPANGTAACGDWREGLRADLSRHDGNFRLVLTGNYPIACGEQRWNIGILPHAQYVLGVFRQLWNELGGSMSGTVRDGAAPAEARVLAAIASPPLAEVVRDINKFSNNVMARQLFLTLGRTGSDAGTQPAADAAVRRWLDERGLRFPELVLDNGSGLSRHGRASPDSIARLLQAAWKSATMPELMSSLPLTAVDGTMKKRLRDGAAAGQAHIKTGSLEGVKTMAGYVLDRSGRRQIVVFFVNHPNAAAAQSAQDALLQWVAERGA